MNDFIFKYYNLPITPLSLFYPQQRSHIVETRPQLRYKLHGAFSNDKLHTTSVQDFLTSTSFFLKIKTYINFTLSYYHKLYFNITDIQTPNLQYAQYGANYQSIEVMEWEGDETHYPAPYNPAWSNCSYSDARKSKITQSPNLPNLITKV